MMTSTTELAFIAPLRYQEAYSDGANACLNSDVRILTSSGIATAAAYLQEGSNTTRNSRRHRNSSSTVNMHLKDILFTVHVKDAWRRQACFTRVNSTGHLLQKSVKMKVPQNRGCRVMTCMQCIT